MRFSSPLSLVLKAAIKLTCWNWFAFWTWIPRGPPFYPWTEGRGSLQRYPLSFCRHLENTSMIKTSRTWNSIEIIEFLLVIRAYYYYYYTYFSFTHSTSSKISEVPQLLRVVLHLTYPVEGPKQSFQKGKRLHIKNEVSIFFFLIT